MAGFAFALALDANKIHIEMHIQLCCSLSRYRESHLTTIKAVHLHLWLVLHLRQPLTQMRSMLKYTENFAVVYQDIENLI